MQRKEIATVRLNRGEVGFYDDLTRIHLTIGAPTAKLYSGMNLSHVRRAIRNGVLVLASGTLSEEGKPLKLVKKGDGFVLMKNGEKKGHAPEKKPAPPAKTAPEPLAVEEKKEEAPVPEATPAKEEKKAPELVEKEAAEIGKEEAAPVVEEAAKEDVSPEPAEEKPKKRGRKKKGSSEEEHADAEAPAQDELKSEDVPAELS